MKTKTRLLLVGIVLTALLVTVSSASASVRSLNVIYPNGGEVVSGRIGVSFDVRVQGGAGTVWVYYSNNSGGDWISIGPVSVSNGIWRKTIDWDTTRDADGSNYKIGLSDGESGGARTTDTSDNTFRVCNNGRLSCSELLNDGFEGKPWNASWNDLPSAWGRSSASHSGSSSAGSRNNREGFFTCDPLDASGASGINVEFWYKLQKTEAEDLKLYYSNDGKKYHEIARLGGGTEDEWLHYKDTIGYPQYFTSKFRIVFRSVLTPGEAVCVDDVVIRTCECVPITYSWWTGEWSECSADCGEGTQTRTVECRDDTGDDTGQTVPDRYCTATKPADTRNCIMQPCTSPITSPSTSPGPTPIPEFSTIALPVASILGLMFFFSYSKRKKQ